ncbi:MAG: hypothetical protein AAB853_00315 [Patescibacteria group bacterium]
MQKQIILWLVPVFLPILLLTVFKGEIAFGQPQRCGDFICDGSENCLTCRGDCGPCSGAKRCGDDLCHLNEGESFEKCPVDCPAPEKRREPAEPIEKIVCGDNRCSLEEDCTSCPEDCGECSYSFRARLRVAMRRAIRFVQRLLREQGGKLTENARIFLEGSIATIENQRREMGERALERSEAATQLLQFLSKNEDVSRHLTPFDARLIERMSDRERANVLTAVPALHVRSKLRRVALAERAEMIDLAKKINMALKPGAIAVFQVPNGMSPLNPIIYGDLTHVRAFSPQSMQQLFLNTSFVPSGYYEIPPYCHGVQSAIRRVLWTGVIKPAIGAFVRMVHGKVMGGNIYTANFIAVASRNIGAGHE